METLLQDLRYGIRMLSKSPVFTIVTIIVLALGIGANTAIFSVVNGVLFRPLPYKDPDRLISILFTDHQQPGESNSPANFTDLKQRSQSFENLVAYCDFGVSLIGPKEPRSLDGGLVSADFFDVLGVKPALGQAFHAGDDKSDGPRLAVLSYKLWQTAFNGDQGVIGKETVFKNEPFSIVGVMPASFDFPDKADVWLMARRGIPEPPFKVENFETQRGLVYFKILGRLKEGVSVERAQAEIDTIAAQLQQQYPDANANKGFLVRPMREYMVRDVRESLLVLLVAVAAVLLIAVANVANLSLARAASRQQEMAIRVALGASRLRIIRQLLTESLALSIAGGAAGLLLALWGTKLLVSLSPSDIPRLNETSIDGRVLFFTIAVSLATGILFGISPSIQASRPNLNEDLKEGARGSTVRGRGYRNILVVAEVSLSIILLISAGLMIKSFVNLLDVNPGFNPRNVLAVQMQLPIIKYSEDQQISDFVDRLIPKIKALPGVSSVGTATTIPYIGSDIHFSFGVEGRQQSSPDEQLNARFDAVSPDFFAAFGVPLIKGRFFTEQDNAKAPMVTIVNQTLAKQYFNGLDPIGQRMELGDGRGVREVVGVVGDIRYDSLSAAAEPEVYCPADQSPWSFVVVTARTSVPPLALAQSIREQVWSIDKDQPIDEIKEMSDYISQNSSRPRFQTILLSSFSCVALTLAAVGIFGVMAYTVSQSTREIGIRMALGAQQSDVLKLIVNHGMVLTGIGIVTGVIAAYFLTYLMSSLLYGVSTRDPAIFVLIPVLLAIVSLVASYLPARRASKVDPLIAIRHE